MATIQKGQILRQDLNLWDGITKTDSRVDATGGTLTGMKIGDVVDVLSVFGSGTDYTSTTINNAVASISTNSNLALLFSTGTWDITGDVTIPANFACIIPAGCVFNISAGVTLTMNGYVETGDTSYTSGSGTFTAPKTVYGTLGDALQSTTVGAGLGNFLVYYEPLTGETNIVNYYYHYNDIRRWGATFDNSTDDLTYINNAISSMNATGGGNLEMPAGTTKVSGNIVMKEGVWLNGKGIGVTKISGTASYKISCEDISNVKLTNFTMEGTGYVQIYVSDTASLSANMENFTFEDLYLDKSNETTSVYNHGIHIKKIAAQASAYYIQKVNINRVKIYGAGGANHNAGTDNLYIASYDLSSNIGSVRDVNVTNCHFEVAGRQNISVAGTTAGIMPYRINISKCTLIDSTLAGIDVESGTEIYIHQCHFLRSGTYTGYFTDTDYAINAGISYGDGSNETYGAVTDCYFDSCNHGLTCLGGKYPDISGCTFVDSDITDSTFASFGDAQFVNCRFISSGSAATLVNCYSGSWTFTNCIFKGTCSTAQVNVSSGAAAGQLATQHIFNGCKFVGDGSTTIGIKTSYQNLEINGCHIYNYQYFLDPNQVNRFEYISVTDNVFNTVDICMDFAIKEIQSLKIKGNSFYSVVQAVNVAQEAGDITIVDNHIEALPISTDGYNHSTIRIVYGARVKILGNVLLKSASADATDAVGIYVQARTTGVTTGAAEHIDISNNAIFDYSGASDAAITLAQYSSDVYPAGYVVNNHDHNCTTGVSSTAGVAAGNKVESGNLSS